MKKTYTFGEMLYALREEYNSCKPILEELRDCVYVDDSVAKCNVTGVLKFAQKDKGIELVAEKDYPDVLKKINSRVYSFYGRLKYIARFDLNNHDGIYGFDYREIPSPISNKKLYIPKVEIKDQDKVAYLVDELYKTEIMQLEESHFNFNNDSVFFYFDRFDCFNNKGDFRWDGMNDIVGYSMPKSCYPFEAVSMFTLKMHSDDLSKEWLQILEKHECKVVYDLGQLKKRKDILKFGEISDMSDGRKKIKLINNK